MAESELEVLKGIADMLSDIRAGIAAIEDTSKEALEEVRGTQVVQVQAFRR